jgi:excisionase family DNA binding protein
VQILEPRVGYSYAEAAAQLCVSESFISAAVRDGELEAHWLNGTTPRIHREELDRYLRESPTARRSA